MMHGTKQCIHSLCPLTRVSPGLPGLSAPYGVPSLNGCRRCVVIRVAAMRAVPALCSAGDLLLFLVPLCNIEGWVVHSIPGGPYVRGTSVGPFGGVMCRGRFVGYSCGTRDMQKKGQSRKKRLGSMPKHRCW